MVDGDLMLRPVGELAALVRSGELSAAELLACSLGRIEELDPGINAFVEVDSERAMAAAARIGPGDGRPFAGVPIAIKNNRAVAGLRMTNGSELLAQHVPGYDHSIVARLRAAGFVIVGTTTLPEQGILPTSEARLFGPTRNPWDPGRTPGGSSGGAAAALAAGMVPIAHGNDGGGSLRIPAACCGLVGLKGQRGRTSLAPEVGDSAIVVDGVLTRTVHETAALLDVIAGYETGDATWAPPPARPFAAAARAGREGREGREERERRERPLRIAATTLSPLAQAPVDPEAARAVGEAAELLVSLGHRVEEADPPWRAEGLDLEYLFGTVFQVEISLSIAAGGLIAGRVPSPDDLEPMSWAIFERVRAMSALEARGATARLQGFARALIRWMEPYDALLTPALAERPLPLGTLDTAAPEPLETFARSGHFTPFTPVFNATGQPAIALPLFSGSDGLPLAVQLVGPPAREDILLSLGAELEEALPWTGRRARGC